MHNLIYHTQKTRKNCSKTMENDLESLTNDQRDMVTTFMAITAVENSSTAVQFLKMCDFNLEVSPSLLNPLSILLTFLRTQLTLVWKQVVTLLQTRVISPHRSNLLPKLTTMTYRKIITMRITIHLLHRMNLCLHSQTKRINTISTYWRRVSNLILTCRK